MQTLQIETINTCNAMCVFCPVSGMKRKREVMKDELFAKIIEDAKEIDELQCIMPFLNGEPLLDVKLIDRISLINEKLPNVQVAFYSNGVFLDEKKAFELAKVRVNWINFSINAVNDVERMAVMGVPYRKTVENILRYRNMETGTRITVSAVHDPSIISASDSAAFVEFWSREGIKPMLFNNGNWGGKTRKSYVTTSCCSRPSTDMVVLSDGNVALCCYDLESDITLGNLNTQSIKEVWESDLRKKYADDCMSGKRNGLPLCKDCTTG